MNLIDRDEIVKVAEHAFKEWNLAMAAADGKCEINRVFKMKELCRAVEAVAMAAPIIDAAPVVHGEWSSIPIGLWQCTRCAKIYDYAYNYCPNCGADMREMD